MSQISIDDPLAAVSYLESIRLPRPPMALEDLGDESTAVPPDYSSGTEQAVTVGSQIAEFAANVPAGGFTRQ